MTISSYLSGSGDLRDKKGKGEQEDLLTVVFLFSRVLTSVSSIPAPAGLELMKSYSLWHLPPAGGCQRLGVITAGVRLLCLVSVVGPLRFVSCVLNSSPCRAGIDDHIFLSLRVWRPER